MFSEANTPERQQFAQLIESHGGKDVLDTRRHGLVGVMESTLFQQAMPGSRNQDSIAVGKLAICARSCGRDYDPLERQRY